MVTSIILYLNLRPYILNGGKYSNEKVHSTRFFDGGDTLNYDVKIESLTKNGTADSSISIFIQANVNSGGNVQFVNGIDETTSRLKNGDAGIGIDMSVVQDRTGLQPIKIKNVTLAKTQ